jgi:hypothetical protein
MPTSLEKVLGVDLLATHTVAKHAVGMETTCDDGTRRKYVKAAAAIAANDALKINVATGPYFFTPTTAALDPVAGVAAVAIASGSFGWVIVSGKATVKVAAAITAGAHLAATATAGTLDDVTAAAADAQAAAAGKGVVAIVDDVPSAGLATVVLN